MWCLAFNHMIIAVCLFVFFLISVLLISILFSIFKNFIAIMCRILYFCLPLLLDLKLLKQQQQKVRKDVGAPCPKSTQAEVGRASKVSVHT